MPFISFTFEYNYIALGLAPPTQTYILTGKASFWCLIPDIVMETQWNIGSDPRISIPERGC